MSYINNINSINAFKMRKSKFLDLKKQKEIYGSKTGKTPKASNSHYNNSNLFMN